MAHWLDTVCYPFDYAILSAIHRFTEATNGAFTLPLEMITFLANKGLCMILLGLLLCCFLKSRRTGVTVLFAIACGALITNIVLKNAVVRPRPYADEARVFYEWWVYISDRSFFGFTVSDHSFPSGHTTSAMAAMTAVFLTTSKKKSWPVFIFAALMGFSRMYLMVHYPTDVLAGLLAGALGAIGGYFLVKLLYRLIEKHSEWPLIRFYNSFDLIALFRKLLRKKQGDDAAAPACEATEAAVNAVEKEQTPPTDTEK